MTSKWKKKFQRVKPNYISGSDGGIFFVQAEKRIKHGYIVISLFIKSVCFDENWTNVVFIEINKNAIWSLFICLKRVFKRTSDKNSWQLRRSDATLESFSEEKSSFINWEIHSCQAKLANPHAARHLNVSNYDFFLLCIVLVLLWFDEKQISEFSDNTVSYKFKSFRLTTFIQRFWGFVCFADSFPWPCPIV
jgi:hypothetical protein